MKSLKTIAVLFTTMLLPFLSMAQNDVEMADIMRSNGKIYVVVAVISVILAGLFVYLIVIDKKVRMLEKRSEKR